jgi:hypothetical protein
MLHKAKPDKDRVSDAQAIADGETHIIQVR